MPAMKLRKVAKILAYGFAGIYGVLALFGYSLWSADRLNAADCAVGYAQGPGGYYRTDDRSGPYFLTPGTCAAVPISGPVSAGGVTQADTVVQSVAVYRGGTIATANVSQQLMAANPARRGWTFQNQSTTDLYVKVGQAATTTNASLRIAPGATYETQPQHTSGGVINVIGATAGQAFYATEY